MIVKWVFEWLDLRDFFNNNFNAIPYWSKKYPIFLDSIMSKFLCYENSFQYKCSMHFNNVILAFYTCVNI
jgi:hypothetical protein